MKICIYCQEKTMIGFICQTCSDHLEYWGENRKAMTEDIAILKHQTNVGNVFIFESELNVKDFNLNLN